MQIRRAHPEAVERHVGVAESFAEMLEAMRVTRIQRALVDRERICVRIEPAPVGVDERNRSHLADLCSGEILAADAMTVGAVFLVDAGATLCEWLIDGERIQRRFEIE